MRGLQIKSQISTMLTHSNSRPVIVQAYAPPMYVPHSQARLNPIAPCVYLQAPGHNSPPYLHQPLQTRTVIAPLPQEWPPYNPQISQWPTANVWQVQGPTNNNIRQNKQTRVTTPTWSWPVPRMKETAHVVEKKNKPEKTDEIHEIYKRHKELLQTMPIHPSLLKNLKQIIYQLKQRPDLNEWVSKFEVLLQHKDSTTTSNGDMVGSIELNCDKSSESQRLATTAPSTPGRLVLPFGQEKSVVLQDPLPNLSQSSSERSTFEVSPFLPGVESGDHRIAPQNLFSSDQALDKNQGEEHQVTQWFDSRIKEDTCSSNGECKNPSVNPISRNSGIDADDADKNKTMGSFDPGLNPDNKKSQERKAINNREIKTVAPTQTLHNPYQSFPFISDELTITSAITTLEKTIQENSKQSFYVVPEKVRLQFLDCLRKHDTNADSIIYSSKFIFGQLKIINKLSTCIEQFNSRVKKSDDIEIQIKNIKWYTKKINNCYLNLHRAIKSDKKGLVYLETISNELNMILNYFLYTLSSEDTIKK